MSVPSDQFNAFPPSALAPLLTNISTYLTNHKQTISIAETATGGLISAALLSVPGASAYYKGGLTLYTLESRIKFGGWTQETIKGYKYVFVYNFVCRYLSCLEGRRRR